MAWYYYLEEQLTVPFEAEVRKRSPTSPLSPGDQVQVIAMAPEDVCESEAFVWIRWNKRKLCWRRNRRRRPIDGTSVVGALGPVGGGGEPQRG